MASASYALPEDEGEGLIGRIKAALPPRHELRKMIPLTLMFFCILFNYTILRDTKDVLVVTAPGGGAEAIPFLKTWVNLPGAIGFTLLYGALAVIEVRLMLSTIRKGPVEHHASNTGSQIEGSGCIAPLPAE